MRRTARGGVIEASEDRRLLTAVWAGGGVDLIQRDWPQASVYLHRDDPNGALTVPISVVPAMGIGDRPIDAGEVTAPAVATFQDGALDSDPIDLTVNDDQEVEPHEGFEVQIGTGSGYSVDPNQAAAPCGVWDDDADISVESKVIMLTSTDLITIHAEGWYGPKQVDLAASGYDPSILGLSQTQLTTDSSGNVAVYAEGLAEGSTNLIFAAPNGNQGQANQQVKPVNITVVANPPVYVGQTRTIDVRLTNPANGQAVTDLGVVGESQDPGTVTTPTGDSTADAGGVYHVQIKGKSAGAGVVQVRAVRPADMKEAGTKLVNVTVKPVQWTKAVNPANGNVALGAAATVTLTAIDPTTKVGISGIGVTANMTNGFFTVNPDAGFTDQNGVLVFTVTATSGNPGDQDTLVIHVDGWDPANNPVFTRV